jgi:hypothetical protein
MVNHGLLELVPLLLSLPEADTKNVGNDGGGGLLTDIRVLAQPGELINNKPNIAIVRFIGAAHTH